MIERLSFLRDFRAYPDFLRLVSVRLFGGSAMQMLMVAVAWQMYELTGSAWDLGLVGLVQFLPALVFTLVAGHATDRYPRSRILALCLALQTLCAAGLLAATLTHTLTRDGVLTVSVALGLARAFQMPSQQALIGSLLPRDVLPRGAALNSAMMQITVIGGPAVAGLLFMASAASVHAVSLALLVMSLAQALRMAAPRPHAAGQPMSLHSLLAGVRFVFTHRTLLGAFSLDLMAVLLGGATALLPIFAKDILHVGPAGLGALRAAPAVGALACSLLLSHRPLQRRVGRTLMVSVAIYGVCMLVFGLSTSFLVSLVALAISGAADMVSVIVRGTLMQLETPDEIRGRVGAVASIFIGASNQLGEFESGAMAAWLGPVGSVLAGGVGTLLVVAAWWPMFPGLVRRDTFHGEARPAA